MQSFIMLKLLIKVGEQVIVLEKDLNSKNFARWQTGEICQKLSPYTYIVSMPNGSRRHLHANKLRKLVVPVTHIGIISENDTDFGKVLAVPPEKVDIYCLPSQRIDLISLSHLSVKQQIICYSCLMNSKNVLMILRVCVRLCNMKFI